MKKSTKIALGATAVVAAGAAIVTPIVVSAWGDNSGGRTTYTIDQINNDRALDKDGKNIITLNSITNNPNIGDERNFVGAREDTGVNAGIKNTWNANEINAEDGKTYLVRIYTHNNNPNGEQAVAKDVTNRFDISTDPGKSVEVRGYITSSNATPSQYWDNVVFKSDNTFHLEYVKGSAHFENNGVGKGGNGGAQLSDAITSTGVKIGYNSLDGNIPGCFQYAGYTTIKVKVVYDHEYTVDKVVRKAGSTNKADWTDLLTANVGDEVEYQITYTNTSKSTTQEHVTFKDILPNNVEYVKGSTTLYNATYPKGTKIAEDNLVNNGIRVGNYTAGSNAIIRFRGKVVDKNLACGKNEITNWAQVGVASNTKQDAAKIMVTKDCTTSYKVDKLVRKAGDSQWVDSLTVNPGDTVEYKITYTNTGQTDNKNVVIKDILPAHVSYVAGSTTLNGKKVSSDKLVTDGINIGDYAAGKSATVQFQAKIADAGSLVCGKTDATNKAQAIVNKDTKQDTAKVTVDRKCSTNYTIQKLVRKAGGSDKDWTDDLTANINDEIEYKIVYKNTGDTTINNVVIKDILPENIEYVKGSTTLNGKAVGNDKIVSDGINAGNVAAGKTATVQFKAKVVNTTLACGKNQLTNKAQAVVNKDTKQDIANVEVQKDCYTPTPTPGTTTVTSMPETGAGTLVAGSVIGAGALVTSAGYYIASRKRLH